MTPGRPGRVALAVEDPGWGGARPALLSSSSAHSGSCCASTVLLMPLCCSTLFRRRASTAAASEGTNASPVLTNPPGVPEAVPVVALSVRSACLCCSGWPSSQVYKG
jgi:hypothetical protein